MKMQMKIVLMLIVLAVVCSSSAFGAILLDSGDVQYGVYGGTDVTTNYTDGVITDPATKFDFSGAFTAPNLYLTSPVALSSSGSFDADVYGDGSGTWARVSLYVDPYDGDFIYQHIVLDFVGWQHVSLNLADMAAYTPLSGMTTAEFLGSSIGIVGISGPWAGSGVMIMDNMTIVPEPATLTMLGMGLVGLLRRKK